MRNNKEKNFNFINSGFNLRPTDIQGAIGSSQFDKLDKFKKNRVNNRQKIITSIIEDNRWKNQFYFFKVPKNVNPSYMVFPILLNPKMKFKKKSFINLIEKKGLQTRPIISGSFLNQPATKLYSLNKASTVSLSQISPFIKEYLSFDIEERFIKFPA